MRATQEREQHNDESTVAAALLFVVIFLFLFFTKKAFLLKFMMITSKLEGDERQERSKHNGNRLASSVQIANMNNSDEEIICVV